MGANSNLFNVCTVVYVIVTRGPVLESIERDSMDEIPGTVSVCDVKERLETVGLSNSRTYIRVGMQKENGPTWATSVKPEGRRLLTDTVP